ncbi:MAG: pirin family protein [Rhodospirillales bacterium]|nr:pirin family protein [Rhodospirillales bacterium]
MTTPKIVVRPSEARGPADFGWLKSRHSFSFGSYYDPNHMGFRALRVINEDRVAPETGFDTHGHRDMEIVTYVLDGAIRHKDSMGNGEILRAGEVQAMSAGTGVMHSEYNASDEDPVHFLQIWLLPDRNGHKPRYAQRAFERAAKLNRFALVVSPDGADGSVEIHQDTRVYATILEEGKSAELTLRKGRHAWVQVARGSVDVAGTVLKEGDGAAVSQAEALALTGLAPESEVLVFDLA